MILNLCIHKGMRSGRRQAIDSAYVEARTSRDSVIEKEMVADAAQPGVKINLKSVDIQSGY